MLKVKNIHFFDFCYLLISVDIMIYQHWRFHIHQGQLEMQLVGINPINVY